MKEEFEDIKGVIKNPYIEEEQTTQWPKEKVQMDKQRSTKHTKIGVVNQTWILIRIQPICALTPCHRRGK